MVGRTKGRRNFIGHLPNLPHELRKYIPSPVKRHYRYVWSAAELQAKNEEWQMVCANVFGLKWSP
jgi:hypothetical protein